MNVYEILKRWRGSQAPAGATPGTSATEDIAAAVEFMRLGVLQRKGSQYDDAALNLARAIELQHDFAPAHHNLGLVYLVQGRFEDAADSLELATHFAPGLCAAHLDLADALAQLGRYDAAESACRRALELEPNSAMGWFRLGNIVNKRGDLSRAVQCYGSAVAHDPSFADAHCQQAFVLYKLGRYEESLKSHATALALNPEFVEGHHNLGLLQLETGYPNEALASFGRAIALRPETIATRTCVAHALRDLGRLEEALVQYDAVLAEAPQFGDAFINRCYTLLMREDYSAGWAQYEQRFAATSTPLRGFPFAEWRGEPLTGKRILVYAEQGLGDEIMFASCLPDVLERCEDVVIECNTRLASLYARSFPRALVHGGSKQDDKSWLAQLADVDYQVAIGSLPLHFRQTRSEFPARRRYFVADASREEFWRRRFGSSGQLRVGIAWRGGSLRTRQLVRSLALKQWIGLLQQPRIEFMSLQYGDTEAELAQLRSEYGVAISDFSRELADLDELAAAISALDLVISVDNTVAHLAGALGQNVWVLLNSSPEWRYLRQGADMPWYPLARVFRQPQPRAWEPMLEQAAHALQHRARTHGV